MSCNSMTVQALLYTEVKSPQYSVEVGWAPELFWLLCRTENSCLWRCYIT